MFNILKEEDRKFWNEQGYLHIKQILSPQEVKKTLHKVDKAIERYVGVTPSLQDPANKLGKGSFRMLRAIERTSAIDKLIDHSNLFPIIVDLMGPYIQILGTEIFARHPSKDIKQFHTDSGPSLQNILPSSNNLPIQLKALFFLTDVLSPDNANFCLFPKSHIKRVSETLPDCTIPEVNLLFNKGTFPSGAIQLLANAGDVIIFPWSLWHGVSQNLSSTTRRTVVIRYGQLWCRPRDYEKLPAKILKRLSPRQKRLFGIFNECQNEQKFSSNDYRLNKYYHPEDQIELIMKKETIT